MSAQCDWSYTILCFMEISTQEMGILGTAQFVGFPDPHTVVSLNDSEGKSVRSAFIPASIMHISKPKWASHVTVYTVNIQRENTCQQVPPPQPGTACDPSFLSHQFLLRKGLWDSCLFHSTKEGLLVYYHLKNNISPRPLSLSYLKELHNSMTWETRGGKACVLFLFGKQQIWWQLAKWFAQSRKLMKWTAISYTVSCNNK